MPADSPDDGDFEILAETENYGVLKGFDEEGEPVYSIELGMLTLHLYEEEWNELVDLIRSVGQ